MTFSAPWECDDDLRTIFDASGAAVAFLPIPPDPARTRLLLAAPRLLDALALFVEELNDPSRRMPLCEWDNFAQSWKQVKSSHTVQLSYPLEKMARAIIAEIRDDGE